MNITLCCITEKFDEDKYSKINNYLSIFNQILIITQYNSVLNTNKLDVFEIKFINDYSMLRNFALSKVKHDWVLFLDSDEDLSTQLKNKLLELIKSNKVDGYWISRRNYLNKNSYLKHGLFYPDYQLRLIRKKSEYHFKGKVHEIIQIPLSKTIKIHSDIYHYPRNQKYSKFSDFKNFLPYIKIEAEDLIKDDRIAMWYLLNAFYKSTTIFLSAYFRGKGFLDGWAGLRAHLIFAFYIFYLNFTVGLSKLLRKNILE